MALFGATLTLPGIAGIVLTMAIAVDGPEQMKQLMEEGDRRRRVAETAMNATSSRSHAMFIVTVLQARFHALPMISPCSPHDLPMISP